MVVVLLFICSQLAFYDDRADDYYYLGAALFIGCGVSHEQKRALFGRARVFSLPTETWASEAKSNGLWREMGFV